MRDKDSFQLSEAYNKIYLREAADVDASATQKQIPLGKDFAPVLGKAGAGGAKAGDVKGQSLVVLDKTSQGMRQTVLEAVHFVPLKSGVA